MAQNKVVKNGSSASSPSASSPSASSPSASSPSASSPSASSPSASSPSASSPSASSPSTSSPSASSTSASSPSASSTEGILKPKRTRIPRKILGISKNACFTDTSGEPITTNIFTGIDPVRRFIRLYCEGETDTEGRIKLKSGGTVMFCRYMPISVSTETSLVIR